MVGELAGCLPLEPIRDITDILKARAVIQETSKLIDPNVKADETISESSTVTIT